MVDDVADDEVDAPRDVRVAEHCLPGDGFHFFVGYLAVILAAVCIFFALMHLEQVQDVPQQGLRAISLLWHLIRRTGMELSCYVAFVCSETLTQLHHRFNPLGQSRQCFVDVLVGYLVALLSIAYHQLYQRRVGLNNFVIKQVGAVNVHVSLTVFSTYM